MGEFGTGSIYHDDKQYKFFAHACKQETDNSAHALGQGLVNQNYRSVNKRYNKNSKAPVFKYSYLERMVTPDLMIQALKACDCYDYQSCEIEDYSASFACRIIEQIRSGVIQNLPGYSKADWEISDN